MKKIFKAAVIAICLTALSLTAYAYDKGDFQIWNTDTEDVKLYKGVRLSMEQEFRFGENASEFFYQHYEFGVFYNFAKMLDLGFAYRLVIEKFKHKWREEDMPNVNAILKFDLWKFKIDDRNRLEYRHFRFRDDSIRYRNRLSIKYPIEFKKIIISPYLADEIFISSDATGFNENRFSSGIEFGLTQYVKADIYYMLKDNRLIGRKWTDANVLGTKAKIAF